MSLRKQSTSAFFWSSGQQVISLLINLISSVWLARILGPKDFGLIGMISIFIAIGNVLMTGGLGASLIRSVSISKDEKSSVFFLNIILGFLIYFIIFITADWISNFYEVPILKSLIKWYSLVIIIRSFSSVQFALLIKALDFKKTAQIRFLSLFLGAVTGLTLAYLDFGVWSLIWMYLVQATVDSLVIWIWTDWVPSFTVRFQKVHKHLLFGGRIAISELLDATFEGIYNLIIGKIYNAKILGYYTRSYTLMRMPIMNVQEVFERVLFPTLSQIQDDKIKMNLVFKKSFNLIALFSSPILIFAIIVSEPLFRFFLTEKWLPAVPFFQLLCVSGIFYPLSKINLNILKVFGRGSLYLNLGIFEKSLIIVGVAFVVPFGIYGLLCFQIASNLLAFILNASYGGKAISYGLKEQTKDLFKILIISLAAGLPTFLITFYKPNFLGDFILLIFCASAYFLTLLALVSLFFRRLLIEVIESLGIKKLLFEK